MKIAFFEENFIPSPPPPINNVESLPPTIVATKLNFVNGGWGGGFFFGQNLF